MTPEEIARVAHATNVAYCEVRGLDRKEAWDDTDPQIRQGTTAAVRQTLMKPDISPDESHAAWMKDRAEAGWVYDKEYSVVRRTHPNMRPYHYLSVEEKTKDALFLAIVRACVSVAA